MQKKASTRSLDTPLSPFVYTSERRWDMSETDFHKILGQGKQRHESRPWTTREIREAVRDLLVDTYMQKLASLSRHIVVGALPGTSSDYDSTGKTEERFLHIPRGATTGDGGNDSEDEPVNFTLILEFYKNVAGIEFDVKHGFSPPFGRGYGIFSQ